MLKETVEWCKPSKGSKYSACIDLRAKEDYIIGAGQTILINLGVCIDLDNSNVYKTSDYRFAEKKQASKETLEVIKKQELSDFKREPIVGYNIIYKKYVNSFKE